MVPLFYQESSFLESLFHQQNINIRLQYNTLGCIFSGYQKEKFGYNLITMPPLVPYMGAYIIHNKTTKVFELNSSYRKLFRDLFDALPKYDVLIQHWYPNQLMVLPLLWKNFEVSPRFTYILSYADFKTPEQIFNNFQPSLKRQIKKAEAHLKINQTTSSANLFKIKQIDAKERNTPLDFNEQYLYNYSKNLIENNAGFILEAQTSNNETIASALFAYDNLATYYLVGAVNPKFRQSAAPSLLLWHGIIKGMQHSQSFNFEGSMVPEINKYFSTFGGTLTLYYGIKHFKSKSAKVLMDLKSIF